MHAPPNGRPLPRRLALAFLAVLHVFTMAAVPLADAWLEAESTRVVHVESPGSDCDYPHHDHLVCTLCRVAGLAGAPVPPVPGTAAAPSLLSIRQDLSYRGPSLALERGTPLGSRAPPRA